MNNKLKYQVATGVVLIILGITLLLTNYISEKREEVFSEMNLYLSELNEETTTETTETEKNINTEEENKEEEISSDTEKQVNTNYENYIGTLEIPKIGLYKGFYSKNSTLNDVKINIKILDVSNYPDEKNGNVIIIGHSGNYSNSYFANLYQLQIGDTASIYYNNKKYNYKIDNIYTDEKDGTVTIYRDDKKSTLTLITCTKDDDTKQTIYILTLTSVE